MISGERWMFMWRSAPESCSFTQLVSQSLPTDPRPTPLEDLRGAVLAAAQELAGPGEQAREADENQAPRAGRSAAGGHGADARRRGITLERPPRVELGDYSTNAA